MSVFDYVFLIVYNYLQERFNARNTDSLECVITQFLFALYIPYMFVIFGLWYIILGIWYYATMLPFYALAFPLKYFFLGFNWSSFVLVSQGLALLYVCMFPQITKCLPFSCVEREYTEFENTLESIIKSFEIKPNEIMSIVPLLVQKRQKCSVDCADILMLCWFIFLIGLILSPFFFFIGFIYF